jgi:hypothetical protein
VQAAAVLVPLDFVLIALMHERGFTVAAMAPVGLFLFIQSVIVAVLCRAAEDLPQPPVRAHHVAAAVSLPGYALFVFAAAGVFLLARFLFTRKRLSVVALCFFPGLALYRRRAGFDRVFGDGSLHSCRLDHREFVSSRLSR